MFSIKAEQQDFAASGSQLEDPADLHRPGVVSYLCGSAAGPVRRPHGDVDAGRGLRVGGVAAFGSRQARDDQAAGEATLPKQQAEGGRG